MKMLLLSTELMIQMNAQIRMKIKTEIYLRILMQKNLRQFYYNQNLKTESVKTINLIQKEEYSLCSRIMIKLMIRKNSYKFLMTILNQ